MNFESKGRGRWRVYEEGETERTLVRLGVATDPDNSPGADTFGRNKQVIKRNPQLRD